jgi:antirestriction protein ArdC
MTMSKIIKSPTFKEASLKAEPKTQDDIYTRVTNKILADLEKGNLTWRQPWNSEHYSGEVTFPLRWNDVPYTGINTIMLWATAAEKSYILPHWMTFKQALELKGSIVKGEKGTQIVYADKMVKQEEDKNGETQIKQIPFLKTYTVFNASQINGLPDQFYDVRKPAIKEPKQRNSELEEFFANTKADIYTGLEASYRPSTDRIQMPHFDSFETVTGYYATLAHELTHWTKHSTRLDRDFGRKHKIDEAYAKEELVAEIGACFLAAQLGFEPMPEAQHAAYIQHWLKALNEDKRFIFSAVSHAQKAAEYVQGLQPEPKLSPA